MKPLGADPVVHAEHTSPAAPVTPHTADEEQEINFVWPKIVPGRRSCPLVRRSDKGGFSFSAQILLYNMFNNSTQPLTAVTASIKKNMSSQEATNF